MKNIVNGLGTFVGRDSCVRVTSYFALFLYGLLTEFDLKSEVIIIYMLLIFNQILLLFILSQGKVYIIIIIIINNKNPYN